MILKEIITNALIRGGVSEDHISDTLIGHILALMEGSYTHGYDDGKEDAQTRHKQHVMSVLRKDLQ